MLCALIMAGGVGSRFWPQSTEEKPKQFLKLLGNKTMLQMTYERMNKLIPKENIFIVTNERYTSLVKEQINEIKDVNIITEPCSRNTAPCIFLSALYIKNLLGEVNIACVSSDSYIGKEDIFLDKINLAHEFVTKEKEAIVTIGITPNRPETGYGYIKYAKSNDVPNKVIEFVEKPNLETAAKYLASGDYLWNAGMFIFNNVSMIKEIEQKEKSIYETLKDLPKINNQDYASFLHEEYAKCPKISIDYAVMERSTNIYTIPSDINWDDVGSWNALLRYTKSDGDNNTIKGEVEVINSHNNIIYGHDKKIILLNIDNICAIDSKDVLIIGNKDDLQVIHTLNKK